MKIASILGARPQFIKAATVSRVITRTPKFQEVLIHTGQHFDPNMSDIFFEGLGIPKPDHHLGIGGGSHGQNTGRMIEGVERVLEREKPDWVLVYGDTDSTLAGALAAVKLHIPIAHVEAGLRSFNRKMPEEINRILTDHAASLLFAPTTAAVENLEREGISGERVVAVGDVMYDATLFYKNRARPPSVMSSIEGEAFVVCTIHRAENTDSPVRLREIIVMLNDLSEQVSVVLPLHPRTLMALKRTMDCALNPRIKVIQPVGFLEMVWMLDHCHMVITDSGGLQKEAYFHRKKCITLREETEWIETVQVGANQLCPPSEGLSALVLAEYANSAASEVMFSDSLLYGDGTASEKIVKTLGNC